MLSVLSLFLSYWYAGFLAVSQRSVNRNLDVDSILDKFNSCISCLIFIVWKPNLS